MNERTMFLIKQGLMVFVTLIVIGMLIEPVAAQPSIDININPADGQGALGALDIVFMLLILTVAPSLILMMSSFTRIIIVFSFLRNALGMQQSPPNQVLVGLSLFLTLFIMNPVISQINQLAYQPYNQGEITQQEALDIAQVPMKEFMIRQIDEDSLGLFMEISDTEPLDQQKDTMEQLKKLDLTVLVPAFVTSELKKAFLIGFLLFIPFLAIDLIVASTLMSMGMVMLPPGMISLPFKIMIFVLADGWGLIMSSLVKGFR